VDKELNPATPILNINIDPEETNFGTTDNDEQKVDKSKLPEHYNDRNE
jgi:hypothetical protein